MNFKALLFAIGVFAASLPVQADDCTISQNAIGDWSVVTIGGFTFAKTISIDLAPTNAPMADASYAIRCQVIYRDAKVYRPETIEELVFVRQTGALLNAWLREFVTEQYVGAEFKELVEAYFQKNLAKDLNSKFPAFVREKIDAMDSSARPDVDTVTVTVEAEGELRSALVELYALDKED